MTKKHNSERHLKDRLEIASKLGCKDRFHLFNSSGQLLSTETFKVYDLDELQQLEINDQCALCGNTVHYMTTFDGHKGVLIQKYLVDRSSQA